MIAELLLVSTWFTSPLLAPPCFVTGEVLRSAEQAQAQLVSNCPIYFQREGSLITMTSRKWIVQVTIPEGTGKQSFVYRWGHAEAQIGDRMVVVSYGPVGGV